MKKRPSAIEGRQTTMVRGGAYDEGARPQRTAIALCTPFLLRAAAEVPIPDDGSAFVLADYGSATGRNTFLPARGVIAAVRRRAERPVPVCVVHNDQPTNDFSSLFRLIATDPESYAREPDVFPLAAGCSFYGPVFPHGFVSLGWSANSVHWLSEAPHTTSDRLAFQHPGDGVETPFSRRAHEDWTCFLSARTAELRHAGQLVVVQVESDERGSCGADHFLDALTQVVTQQVQSGIIRAEERARMFVPLYFRTEREIRAPLAAHEADGCLTLVEYEHAVLEDPLWSALGATGDADGFARDHVAWLRGYSENAVFGALDGPPERRRAIADEAYDGVRALVRAAPDQSRCSWKLALLRMRRR